MINAAVRRVALSGSRLVTLPIRTAAIAAPASRTALIHTTAALNAVARKAAPKASTTKKTTAATTKTKTKTKAKAKTTPAKKPAAKKKTVAKKKVVAKKPVKKVAKKPVKKTLTPEQKERLAIKKLKEISLLSEQPKNFPERPQIIFFIEYLNKKKAEGTPVGVIQAMKDTSAMFKELPSSQIEVLEKTARDNKARNAEVLAKWISKHPIPVILKANAARRALVRKNASTSRRATTLEDPRVPKRPQTSYLSWVQSKRRAGELSSTGVQTHVQKKLAVEWKALSESEKQQWTDKYKVALVKYNEVMAKLKGELEV